MWGCYAAGAEQRPASGSSMRCNRSKDWIHHTTCRLTGLIGQALPPLAAHPRTAVRVALAQGAPPLQLTYNIHLYILLAAHPRTAVRAAPAKVHPLAASVPITSHLTYSWLHTIRRSHCGCAAGGLVNKLPGNCNIRVDDNLHRSCVLMELCVLFWSGVIGTIPTLDLAFFVKLMTG